MYETKNEKNLEQTRMLPNRLIINIKIINKKITSWLDGLSGFGW